MNLLAIETSCDETAAAVLSFDGNSLLVAGEAVSSQVKLHAPYGGVVPNLAAREHVANIIPIVETALRSAHLHSKNIDALAVTQGPGLIPALLVGISAAKTLALAWQKPLLGINHLEGHIYANLLAPGVKLHFPLLALVVSGGHTQLVLMTDHFRYTLLGETEDDAVGEAFDKVARMLGLSYPGGPEIGERADNYRKEHMGEKAQWFPRPLLEKKGYQFSFSGLKTAVLYFLQKHETEKTSERFIASVCHEFQEAAIDTLVGKTEQAIQEFQPKTLVIAGGVSANLRLREQIEHMIAAYPDCQFLMPPFRYSLDNAAMIGTAALIRFSRMNEPERETLKKNIASLEPVAHFPLTNQK